LICADGEVVMKRILLLLLIFSIILSFMQLSANVSKRIYVWNFIHKNKVNTVFVTSPARFPDQTLLDAGIRTLQSAGLTVIVGDSCRRYLSDEEKAREINEAFADPNIDMIITSRGGHGSFRVLDYLDWKTISKNPKPIVGYSDITALLLGIYFKTGIITYHGPMVTVELDNDGKSLEKMLKLLNGDKLITFDYNSKPIVPGKMVGRLIVGNLSLFKTLQGTKYFGSLKDSILVLEDVGESRESIERMVWNIAHLKDYQTLRGIVFAGFTQINNDDFDGVFKILERFFEDAPFPVWVGLPVFHGNFTKLTLPVGAWVEMDLENHYIKILNGPEPER